MGIRDSISPNPHARVVVLATPNNPAATLVPLAALEFLASQLDGVLVVDEAYIDYALSPIHISEPTRPH